MFALDEQIIYNYNHIPCGNAQRGIRSGNLKHGCGPLYVVLPEKQCPRDCDIQKKKKASSGRLEAKNYYKFFFRKF